MLGRRALNEQAITEAWAGATASIMASITDAHLEAAVATRADLWKRGYRPLPVLTCDKKPLGDNWPERARQAPPECIRLGTAVKHALNSGILCDGLRALDLDIDDPELVQQIAAVAFEMLRETAIRYRANSPRVLLPYRATEGEPTKTVLAGKRGKIEVLGKGQQFVAGGYHPSGAAIQWKADLPPLVELSAVSEDQLHAFLAAAAPLLEAEAPTRTNGHDHTSGEAQADSLRIAAALGAISQRRASRLGSVEPRRYGRVARH